MNNKKSSLNKKDYFKQKVDLLTLNSEFQKDILKFRKKWSIPKNGFKDCEGTEEYQEWLDKISDEYTNSEAYKTQKRLLSNKMNLATSKNDPKLYLNTKEELRLLESKTPLNDYFNDQEIIATKYELSENYKMALSVFLLSSVFYPVYVPKTPVRVWYERNLEDKKKIFIEVYAETTIEDIREAWPMIKKWQKDTLGYKKGRKRKTTYYSMNKRIFELHQKNTSNEDISTIIEKEFGRKILYYDISKIINRFKKGI